jgi:release factor glutamine methyltransferase
MYEPAEDSFMLQRVIVDFCKLHTPKKFLDMGSGSGLIALSASDFCEVLACDIDDESLDFINKTCISKNISNVQIRKSNLFEHVDFSEKFDVIAFNPPYLPKGEDDYDDSALYGGESGEELTLKFLLQAKNHLTSFGRIFFIASSLASIELIENKMKEMDYKFSVVEKEHYFFEDIILYEAHL